MARTALAVQQLNRAGVTPAYASANSSGNSFSNDGRCFVHLKNTGAAVTVTVPIPVSVDGQAVAGRTVVVAATTGDKMIGPFPAAQYNQLATDPGSVYLDYSAVAGLSVGVFSVAGD